MLEPEPHTNGLEEESNQQQVELSTDILNEQESQNTDPGCSTRRPAGTVQDMPKRASNQPKRHRKQQPNLKREKLLAALPSHEWNIPKAAIAVGYGKVYAKSRLVTELMKDESFCAAIDKRRLEIEREGVSEANKILNYLSQVRSDTTQSTANRLKATELHMKNLCMLTERRVIETTDRTAELDDSQEAEAKRLASIRFRPTG